MSHTKVFSFNVLHKCFQSMIPALRVEKDVILHMVCYQYRTYSATIATINLDIDDLVILLQGLSASPTLTASFRFFKDR